MASPASDPAAAASHLKVEEPAAVAVAVAEEAVVVAADVEKEGEEGEEGGEEEEEEEEGECGFCLYMKGGGCKEAFVAWEECVEAAGKEEGSDMVERCFEVTANLKKCMDAHAEYYAPVLRAEQAVNDHADAAIAAADETKEGEEEEEKLDAVAQEAASAADEKKQEVEEKSSSSSSSSPATIDERKEKEVVTEKADSLSN
uniref:GCK domain-containing protein n=1 Tax=Oryza punctata TaxID=4537 RepID=A0A0E0LHB6_ORYPU